MLLAELLLAATCSFAAPSLETAPTVALPTASVATTGDDWHGFWKKLFSKKRKKRGEGSKPVPEPMTMSLLGLGGAGLVLGARRRRRNAAAES